MESFIPFSTESGISPSIASVSFSVTGISSSVASVSFSVTGISSSVASEDSLTAGSSLSAAVHAGIVSIIKHNNSPIRLFPLFFIPIFASFSFCLRNLTLTSILLLHSDTKSENKQVCLGECPYFGHSLKHSATLRLRSLLPWSWLMFFSHYFLNMDCLAPCILSWCFNTSFTASMRSPASMKSQYLQKG